jgi:hypothetical protein
MFYTRFLPFSNIVSFLGGVLNHICAHVKLVHCVMIIFKKIYSYDTLYILCQCALRTDESEISYVCTHY